MTLGALSLAELTGEHELLELLSKELVTSGEADRIAERIEATKRAVKTLRNDKERIAERVTQVITDEVRNLPAQEVQPISKEYVDDLIASLGTDGETDTEIEKPISKGDGDELTDSLGTNDEADTEIESEKQSQDESDEDDQYVITLHHDGAPTASFSEEQQSTVMATVVEFLVAEHGLVNEIGPLPYVPGTKNAILNTEPRHPSGEEMRQHREILERYYVYTNLNSRQKQRYIQRFAEVCGLTADFGGKW